MGDVTRKHEAITDKDLDKIQLDKPNKTAVYDFCRANFALWQEGTGRAKSVKE